MPKAFFCLDSPRSYAASSSSKLLPRRSLLGTINRQKFLTHSFLAFFMLMLAVGAALAQTVTMTSPTNGQTVSSPVHFVATANGGGYPISAIWIYVDDQPVYKTNSASVDAYVAVPAGYHHVVPVAWDDNGGVATESLYITVNGNAGVTISAPSSGGSVGSPVQFVASATAPPGLQIVSMRIYVDSINEYTVYASSLNTSIPLANGGHSVNIHAWDNQGNVYMQTENITVSGGGGGGGGGQYQNNFNATSKWVSQFSLSDGALLYTPQQIDPYFANLGAIGMTKDPSRMPQVTAWMKWYIAHLNWPDKWGLYGTTYNYNVNNGRETSTNDADSTDSYAATFLSLVWNAWQSGDGNARNYIKTISYQLDIIGQVITQTQQGDGLTWAKPDYQIKYLMDNSEAYRGLRDLASLYQNAFGDGTRANYYNNAANAMQKGLLSMWMNGVWAVYKDWYGNLAAPHMGTWYADASAQVFPVLMGVVNSSDSRAQQSYSAFNNAWPGWPSLSYNKQDGFPMVPGWASRCRYGRQDSSQYLHQQYPDQVCESRLPLAVLHCRSGMVHTLQLLHDGKGIVEILPADEARTLYRAGARFLRKKANAIPQKAYRPPQAGTPSASRCGTTAGARHELPCLISITSILTKLGHHS